MCGVTMCEAVHFDTTATPGWASEINKRENDKLYQTIVILQMQYSKFKEIRQSLNNYGASHFNEHYLVQLTIVVCINLKPIESKLD